MALPLAPIAMTAFKYGSVAAVTYYVARRSRSLARESEEAAHAEVEEGISVRHHRGPEGAQANADARIRRTVRFGASGPGVEIDASVLGRVRFRRVRGE